MFLELVSLHNLTYDAARAFVFEPDKVRGTLRPSPHARTPGTVGFPAFWDGPNRRGRDPVELDRARGLYSDVELVMPAEVYAALSSIEFCISGLHVDTLWLGDAACAYLNDAYDRPVVHNAKVVVPLLLAGLTPNCVSTGLAYHEHTLIFDPPLPVTEDVEMRASISKVPLDFLDAERWIIVQQTQHYVHPVVRGSVLKPPFQHFAGAVYLHFGSMHTQACRVLKRIVFCAENIEGPFDPAPGYIVVFRKTPPELLQNVSLEMEWSGPLEEPAKVHVFCHKHALLRTMHGMGGVA